MNFKEPILITGCARSGTSLTAGIIHLSGAWGGKMSGPTKYNAKGMFENIIVRNELTKPYLRTIRCDPMGQHPLPSDEQLQKISSIDGMDWREAILNVMRRQGLRPDKDWFYKGAKCCLFWPMWDYAFPTAKWLIIRRHREDIAKSCLRTGFMRAFDSLDGWLEWVEQHEQRFEQMKRSGLWYREVWPEKMIDGDLSEIEIVIKDLGLSYSEEHVRAFIAPSLWRKGKRG